MSAHCVAISKNISRCAPGGSVFAVSMHLDACSRHVLEVSIGLPLIKGDKAACYGLDRRSRLVQRWPLECRSVAPLSAAFRPTAGLIVSNDTIGSGLCVGKNGVERNDLSH